MAVVPDPAIPDPTVWDAEAAVFDEAPDHGLSDPDVRRAWRELMLELLPPAPARVADLGCGTGTLSLLLAAEGYDVDGLDLSPAMVRRAVTKTSAESRVRIVAGDASQPSLSPATYDVALSRHVLWAMPDPAVAVQRWRCLLAPGGRLVLVEGSWSTGSGLTASETLALVEADGWEATLRRLPDPRLWGRTIADERYVVVSGRSLPKQRETGESR